MSFANPVIVGSAILALTFVSKAFFDAFLKELGKDAYAWVRSKIALAKENEKTGINVVYHVHVGNLFFTDEKWGQKRARFTPARHDRLPHVINAVCSHLQGEGLTQVVNVELIFDETKGHYVEAHCFAVEYREFDASGNVVTRPIHIVRLVD